MGAHGVNFLRFRRYRWVVVEQGRCNFLEYKRGGSLIFPLFLGLGIPTVVVSAFK